MNNLTLEQAWEAIANNIKTRPVENRPLLRALGQTAVGPVNAPGAVPLWEASALDGFALQAGDVAGAGPEHPVYLKVKGRITAGQVGRLRVTPGTAVRIMTGAPVPPGADCVVGFEDSTENRENSREDGRVGIIRGLNKGDNIRRAGDQISAGARLLAGGQVIGPAEIVLLASTGMKEVAVIRRPEVAIIATGEELVTPGHKLSAAKIYCGNASALAAQVVLCGGIARVLSIARDNMPDLKRHILKGLQYDLIVTIGGSSMGDRDLVKEQMADMGRLIFNQLDINPGKSSALALLRSDREGREVPQFALSGNPSAAMLSFEMLVRPAILKMQGCDWNMKSPVVKAGEAFINNGPRTRLVWVNLIQKENDIYAVKVDLPGSGLLPTIAQARGIAILPAGSRVSTGEIISLYPLKWYSQTNMLKQYC
jgi:molybdopterin molybdotransferase